MSASEDVATIVETMQRIIDAGEKIDVAAAGVIQGLLARAADPVDELVIPLRKPIEGHGDPIAALTLREPSAADIEQWDKLVGAPADIKAVSIMAGIPEGAVRKLPAREFYRAARFVGAFLA